MAPPKAEWCATGTHHDDDIPGKHLTSFCQLISFTKVNVLLIFSSIVIQHHHMHTQHTLPITTKSSIFVPHLTTTESILPLVSASTNSLENSFPPSFAHTTTTFSRNSLPTSPRTPSPYPQLHSFSCSSDSNEGEVMEIKPQTHSYTLPHIKGDFFK